jgi:hypothetical protein
VRGRGVVCSLSERFILSIAFQCAPICIQRIPYVYVMHSKLLNGFRKKNSAGAKHGRIAFLACEFGAPAHTERLHYGFAILAFLKVKNAHNGQQIVRRTSPSCFDELVLRSSRIARCPPLLPHESQIDPSPELDAPRAISCMWSSFW